MRTLRTPFSRRAPWDLPENPISRRLAARRQAGAEIIDLTESNPTRVGLSYDERAILGALAQPGALRYEPTPRGLPVARQAIAAYYLERSIVVDPEDLLLCASTSEAYAFLFKLLSNPGEAILVPAPSYPLFEHLAALEGVRARPYPLVYDGTWRIDAEGLRAACTEEVRAILVVSPNNPTGSYLAAAERTLLRELGRPVVCDEVFADYPLRESTGQVTTLADEPEVLSFALSGLSKVVGLPQLKLGWIAAAGPPAARQAALARLELIADTFLSVGTPVQLATPALLRLRPAMQAQIIARVQENRRVLAEALGPRSPAELLDAEGGWYAVLRVPRIRTEEAWVLELLERDGVLCHPGYFFDFAQEAYLVVSLLPQSDPFAVAANRLGQRLLRIS